MQQVKVAYFPQQRNLLAKTLMCMVATSHTGCTPLIPLLSLGFRHSGGWKLKVSVGQFRIPIYGFWHTLGGTVVQYPFFRKLFQASNLALFLIRLVIVRSYSSLVIVSSLRHHVSRIHARFCEKKKTQKSQIRKVQLRVHVPLKKQLNITLFGAIKSRTTGVRKCPRTITIHTTRGPKVSQNDYYPYYS